MVWTHPLAYSWSVRYQECVNVCRPSLMTSRLEHSVLWLRSQVKVTDFSLQDLHNILCSPCTGDVLMERPQLVHLSLSLLTLSVPQPWLTLVGPSAPPGLWPLKEWLQDLVLRFSFLDRVLAGGLAKTATYWLGAFFNPAAFLNIIQQVLVSSGSIVCTNPS